MSSTRDWAARKLLDHGEVAAVRPVGEIFIRIRPKHSEPFSSAILKEDCVHRRSVETVFDCCADLQFITNIPKEGIWTGDAIAMAVENELGWGGFGDLMSAINSDSVKGFQKKEYSFVERGLRQHGRVLNYERIYDRVFLLHRDELPDIKVALVYAYDLTAEHVRIAREKYGEFSVIVKTNPNGEITTSALQVGRRLGVDILGWGDFYGRLNRV